MLSLSNLMPGKRRENEQTVLRPKESLEGIPVLNRNVRLEYRDDVQEPAMMTVQGGEKVKKWRRIPRGAADRHFRLDELGTFVVTQIDGNTKVKRIVDLFQQEFQVNRREAELSVVQFLKTLMRKKLISIAMK